MYDLILADFPLILEQVVPSNRSGLMNIGPVQKLLLAWMGPDSEALEWLDSRKSEW